MTEKFPSENEMRGAGDKQHGEVKQEGESPILPESAEQLTKRELEQVEIVIRQINLGLKQGVRSFGAEGIIADYENKPSKGELSVKVRESIISQFTNAGWEVTYSYYWHDGGSFKFEHKK